MVVLDFPMTTEHTAENAGPEIVIGLVGAVGTDLALVSDALSSALDEVSYRSELIRLSALLQEVDWDRELPETPLDDHIEKHMDAGDALREEWRRGDALALVALSEIADRREEQSGHPRTPASRCAYLLRSLKHPAEVERLRSVYGRRFVLLAAYSPREQRARDLAEGIAASYHSMQPTEHLDSAYRLVQRDEIEEDRDFGQNVRDTFHLADMFIDARSRSTIESAVERIVEIVFGHPFKTPTRDEHAMFLAEAAAMRSSEMGRQVGAVITTSDGEIIAVGTNEVPRPGGGLYWDGDPDDAREFRRGEDSSDILKRRVVGELLARLSESEWLADTRADADASQLYDAIKGTRLASLIEFGRAVHAEMAAIIDAARRGVSIDGGSLYVTTFPCHGCARHIVAAGIERVIYISPYSKSLAATLHGDSIDVDPDEECGDSVAFQPFVGVAPRSYLEYFSMLDRKGRDGKAVDHSKRVAVPRVTLSEPDTLIPPYIQGEQMALGLLGESIEKSGLRLKMPNGQDGE